MSNPRKRESIEGTCSSDRRLEDWFTRWADPVRDGSQFAITGAGQAGLIGGPDGVRFFGCIRDGLIYDV